MHPRPCSVFPVPSSLSAPPARAKGSELDRSDPFRWSLSFSVILSGVSYVNAVEEPWHVVRERHALADQIFIAKQYGAY